MLRIIIINIFLSTFIFASSTQDFLHDLNATYSNEFYSKISFSTDKSIILLSYDKNKTQRRIKEDFEKLFPRYMQTNGLFTKEILTKVNTEKYVLSSYNFIFSSIEFIKLLNKQNKIIQSNKLLEKMLIDINRLMLNSNRIINYMLSIMFYKRLYERIEYNSKEKYALLKKYPPPSKEIFFEKLKFDKQSILAFSKEISCTKDSKREDCKDKNYRKLMLQSYKASVKYTNFYYDKLAIAIKSESKKEIEKFEKFIDKEHEQISSLTSILKYTFSGIKAKIIISLFDEVDDFGYRAEFDGKLSALTVSPRYNRTYIEHINLIKIYNDLIISSKVRF